MTVRQHGNTLPSEIDEWLKARRSDGEARQRAIDLLVAMVGIDSTPKPSPADCAVADAQMFDIIEGFLAACCPDIAMERLRIRPEIVQHPYFTRPYYTTENIDDPAELVRNVYRNRANLFVRWPQPGAPVLALNAHIDTVSPHIGPRIEGRTVWGRGACDDKGACLTMMLALALLCEMATELDVRPACELLLQFVPDEETGGNGSLSAALEKPKGNFDAMIVIEATGLKSYPANRGVVWYRTQLELAEPDAQPAGRDILVEAAAYVVGQLGRCGDQIKAESDHPLFPHRPVQTCHGVLGTYGQHPSRVNDYIPLRLSWSGDLEDALRACVVEAVADYCQHYDDKTRPREGQPVLAAHTTWSAESPGTALLEVHGLAGHMGSVDKLDGAVTKAAWIVRKLVENRRRLGGDWATLTITLPERPAPTDLVLEGGQGFVPTHELEDVAARMSQAVQEGVAAYARTVGLPEGAVAGRTSFEKLHNAAYAARLDGPVLATIRQVGQQMGVSSDEPIRGWDVSCDARIFACEFPEAEVITFGPGQLALAHSNEERIDVDEVMRAAEILARTALQFGNESSRVGNDRES